MSGEHRADQGMVKETPQLVMGNARLLRAGEPVSHGTFAWRRGGEPVHPCPPDMVLVFGDIGQVREEAVGANDLDRLLARQTIQRRFKIVSCCLVLVPVKAD